MNYSDQQLLERFAAQRDEDAFRALARRYLGMILQTARRRTGNAALSQDISQAVLCILARKASSLVHRADSLGPWLHRTTLYESSKAMRAESSHHRKRSALAAAQDQEPSETAEAAWTDAVPHLDRALDKLSQVDRKILFLHFFDDLSFNKIAERIGKSPAATQKRSRRALEKMAAILRSRGVTLSAVALGSLLGAELTKAASASVLHALPDKALSGSLPSVATSTFLSSLSSPMVAALAVLLVAIPIAIQESLIARTRTEVAQVRSTILRAPAPRVAPSSASVSSSRPSRGDQLRSLDAFGLAKAYYEAEKSPSRIRVTVIERYLKGLPPEVLAAHLTTCTDPALAPKYQNPFVHRVVRLLATMNPGLACQTLVDVYTEHPARDFRNQIDKPIRQWAIQDPDKARSWLGQQMASGSLLPALKRKDDLNKGQGRISAAFVDGLMETRPAEVADFLSELPPAQRKLAVGTAVRSHSPDLWAHHDYFLSLAPLLPPEDRGVILWPLAVNAFHRHQDPVAGLTLLLQAPALDPRDRPKVLQSATTALISSLRSGKIDATRRRQLQTFEEWLWEQAPDQAATFVANSLASPGLKPLDPLVQRFAKEQPEMIPVYLNHMGLRGYLHSSTDSTLEDAFLLAEEIIAPEDKARTLTYLEEMRAKNAKNNAAQ